MKTLIVDDDPQITEFIGDYLAEKNHTVFFANDGELALEIYRNEKPDLVICDYQMPKKNGFELYLEISAINNDPPFILVTGVLKNVKSLGNNFVVLEKPVALSILEAAIDKVTNS